MFLHGIGELPNNVLHGILELTNKLHNANNIVYLYCRTQRNNAFYYVVNLHNLLTTHCLTLGYIATIKYSDTNIPPYA